LQQPDYFRLAEVTPSEIPAGDSAEITIRLILGRDFHAPGSRIVLDFPGYLGTSRPTRLHHEIGGFTEVFCANPDLVYTCRVWDMETGDFASRQRSGFMGMAQRLFVLDFKEGETHEGDEVLVKWGYARNGFGNGTRVSSLVLAREFYNTIYLRYFLDGARGLPDYGRSFDGYARPTPDLEIPLRYRIMPREPHHLRLYRKMNGARLLILDRFSNVCQVPDPDPFIQAEITSAPDEYGVFHLRDSEAELASKGLPLYESPPVKGVHDGLNLYFGDLHLHTSFSVDCIERERLEITPAMTLAYAKNVSCLDFAAVTDHHSPARSGRHRLDGEKWRLINEAVRDYDDDPEFAAFAGFELRCSRGDTVVVLGEDFDYGEIAAPEIGNIKGLWERFKGRRYLTIPHFHHPGELSVGEWWACPYDGVETVLEIFSCHGSYESDGVLEQHISDIKTFRPDRHGKYLLQRGFRYGLVCNSDGHKGNAGQNGLTAVYAPELTREAIMEAIAKRHVYGTTNARIRLLFTMNGYLMGDIAPNAPEKRLHVSVAGERPFKAVDILRNGELYRRYKPCRREYTIDLTLMEEEPSFWYVRAVQIDNEIAYSSPIWFSGGL